MTIDEIKVLIASDESRTLELKKSTGELKDGMHSACAFLNTEGGWLIFGIAPKSLKIIGQEVTDKTQQEIAQALAGLEPAVDVHVEYVNVPEYPGNKIIAMYFDGWVWGERPHTFHGCPYIKVESTTQIMSHDMYDERIRAHEPKVYAWECMAADGVTLEDLNEGLIRNCIRRGIDGGRIPEEALVEPTWDILTKWQLLKNGMPTNGAALLFSKNINEYPNFRLRMARFVGTDKNMFRDNQRAEGNFFELLQAGIDFCFKHLSLSGRITNRSLMREEQLEVPYHALREALINALCHRWWEQYNLTISLAIYDDRIEIANPGRFPHQITPENIKKPHQSFPHNLKIAETLYKITYLENWGSGARRIIDACRSQNVEEPTWSDDGGFITITFKRPFYEPISLEKDTIIENLGDNVAQNLDNVAQNLDDVAQNLDDVAQNLDDVAQNLDDKIIQIIESNPSIKREDIANQLSINKKTVERHLKSLGIKWDGHPKTGHWIL